MGHQRECFFYIVKAFCATTTNGNTFSADIWYNREDGGFMKKTILQYIYLLIAIVLMALTVNTVVIPYNIIAGGVSGLSAIVEFAFNLPAATFVFVCNGLLLIVAAIFISPKYAINSILGASILFPLALAVIPVHALSEDILLSVIIGGILTGIGVYFMSMSNGSTGGTAITGKILQKYTGLSYANSVSICDALVVLTGLFIFGITNTMYAIVFIIISSLTANFFEQGTQKTTVFHIITDDPTLLVDSIFKQLSRGVTIIDAKGGYNNQQKQILLCVVKRNDVMRFKALIHEVDADAFYFITSASSTYGEGFTLFDGGIH